MKNKKSGFWNFILSWIPGCSEMYMGFMKMGLSLMAVFWGIILASIVLNLGPLMFLAMIAWFYSFFHARNMYHMDDELFRVTEDRYLFDVEREASVATLGEVFAHLANAEAQRCSVLRLAVCHE